MNAFTKSMLGLTITLAAFAAQADERAPAIAAATAGAAVSSTMGIARALPAYPQAALRRGEHYGHVMLDYDVRPDGTVQNVRVVSSYPRQEFTRAAVGAVERWQLPAGQSGTRRVEFTFEAH